MQTCRSCGADLPENARFCGKCGSMQGAIATDAATTMSTTPQPPYWESEDGTIPAAWPPYSTSPTQGSAPVWTPIEQTPTTPLPPLAEDEDERRRAIPLWSPLYDTALGGDVLLGSGQASAPGAPVVQGTPQIGSVPSVSGSPTPFTNAPAQGPPTPLPARPGRERPMPLPALLHRGQPTRLSVIPRKGQPTYRSAIPCKDQPTCPLLSRDHSRRPSRQESRVRTHIMDLTSITNTRAIMRNTGRRARPKRQVARSSRPSFW